MTKFLPAFFLLTGLSAGAQDAALFKPDSVRNVLRAIPIQTMLRIDGRLNDAEWQRASPSTGFTQIEPFQGEQPRHRTQVRVLYNRQYLYVGIVASDSLGKRAIRATDFKRDFNARSHDHVGLAFDGFNDRRNAMSLLTNPYGVQRDLLAFDDLYYDTDWDGLWRVRTARTDSGWVAELAIPWQTLRYPKTTDSTQQWGLNVYRNRRLSNEVSALSPFPRSFSPLRMDYAGLLTNLQPPPPRPNIRIQPYVLLAYDRYRSPDPASTAEGTKLKVGGELKWAINPNAVLDLTTNTDFAQADADRQVNNVTRFSVFFPERRQFFLENASLFGVGAGPAEDGAGGNMRIQPFFSRRIGLDDTGNPIPIDAGARFVYRSLRRNYGAMLIRQRGVDDSPATNFFVGRFSENVGKQNRLGGLVTVKNQPGHTNVVSAIDGFFRLGEAHSLNTMLIHSGSSNGGASGFAGFAQYQFTNNQAKIWWTQSVVTAAFNPEMGFVSRNDVIGTTPGINWYYRGRLLPFKRFIRAFEPGFLPEVYHQASTGRLVEAQLNLFPLWLNLQNGGFVGYSFSPARQVLTDAFEPLGITISPGTYRYVRHQLFVSSDPSRKVNLFGQYEWGSYFDGRLRSLNTNLQIAPIPHVSLTGRLNTNWFVGVGDRQETRAVSLYAVEGRLALNPRLQLTGFYQHNTETDSRNYNIRLSWEYQPLSFLYVVVNHRGFDGQLPGQTRTDDHAIAKLSYLRQL